ncbi:unnamed protein product [Prunus armeniaca]|uniref:Uncharacterized protein n=1 Tax=Prunus armeniaca TaxID=36596 RepID=A0A6J5XMU4_PRUAR|nr:unnamed protein product [Prunus armeniaca]
MQRISKFDVWLLALSSNSAIPSHVRKEVLASVSIICWEILKERCNAFFSHFPPDPRIVLRKSKSYHIWVAGFKIFPHLGLAGSNHY